MAQALTLLLHLDVEARGVESLDHFLSVELAGNLEGVFFRFGSVGLHAVHLLDRRFGSVSV
jgi:hypothetical protein